MTLYTLVKVYIEIFLTVAELSHADWYTNPPNTHIMEVRQSPKDIKLVLIYMFGLDLGRLDLFCP